VKTLTSEQQAVFDAAGDFIRNTRPARPWFHYTGLAGVGKSEVLAALGRAHPEAVMCAYTGKAASVLARKSGGLPVQTLHQFIYRFIGEDAETGSPYFKRAHKDGALRGVVALVDEMSMLGNYLMKDFLATGCKIIGCLDPGQLQPVRDTGFFRQHAPDARLVTVHRQALDSAIIRQAYNMRNNGVYVDDGDDFRVVRGFSAAEALEADVILCWRNATRHELNRLVRQWKGLPAGLAVAGEPVMCLKNNHDLGILNGAVYELLEDHRIGSEIMVISNERGDEAEIDGAWIEDFETMPYRDDVRPFAFGYACTTHKSQGSSYRNVIFIDEYERTDERREFVYTAITRAEKKILVQRSW
jgi:exodeoxyribonuclease-5